MKKLISTIVLIVMILGISTNVYYAATIECEFSLSTSKTVLSVGDEFKVTIKINEINKIKGATFQLTYDSDVFERTTKEAHMMGIDSVNDNVSGVATVGIVGMAANTTQEIYTLGFRVKQDAPAGKQEISLSCGTMYPTKASSGTYEASECSFTGTSVTISRGFSVDATVADNTQREVTVSLSNCPDEKGRVYAACYKGGVLEAAGFYDFESAITTATITMDKVDYDELKVFVWGGAKLDKPLLEQPLTKNIQ